MVKTTDKVDAVSATHRHQAVEASTGIRSTVFDDRLLTPALFDMAAEEIMGGADDPDGIRIGEAAATAIRRQAKRHPRG